MSTCANCNCSAPTSSREKIRGHNATYLSSVQKQAGKKSSTKAGGENKRQKDASVNGAERTTKTTDVHGDPVTGANVGGFGDGHYVKA